MRLFRFFKKEKSCIRKPNKDEIKLTNEEFYEVCVLNTPKDSAEMFVSFIKNKEQGYNNIVVKESIYHNCLEIKKRRDEDYALLCKTSSLNNKGIALEKDKNIEEAIKVYEENVKLGYPATHSYDRLMILYSRIKDPENEVRIIKKAIEVFNEENNRKANCSIEKNPQFKEQILEALKSEGKVMGDNGFYIFSSYNIEKYKQRLIKARLKKYNNLIMKL